MEKNIVQGDHFRFTLLTNQLVRMEYSSDNQFEDRKTQLVQNRMLDNPDATVTWHNNGHLVEIETSAYHLYYDGGTFDSSNLRIDLKYNYTLHDGRWYFGEAIRNLGGTAETLDLSDGRIPLQNGIMSQDGFAYLDDTHSFVIDENNNFVPRTHEEVDGYFFAYGRDYVVELKDFYRLSGFTPLLPRFAFGNWWSRYYKYTQQEYLDLMARFEKEDIPLSVSVIDMDWHRTDDIPDRFGSGWTGYSWNRKLFPTPETFLKELKKHNKKITLNLHPNGGIRAFEDAYPAVAKRLNLDVNREEPAIFDFNNPDFRESYFKDVHHPLEKEGVDFWWVDWQQGSSRDENKVAPLWSLNHYHYVDNVQRHPGSGLILSRFAGPGSHRYPIGFSGDTFITWRALAFQPEFTATASNIGYTWWSHDIGGHMKGSYDPVLSLRWLQLGVFSPINRLHSSDNPFSGKEPWKYPLNVQKHMTELLQLRAKLVPYLDSANVVTHQEGIPLIEPLYYRYPNHEESYLFKNQYFFGSELMVAPITSPQDDTTELGFTDVWLPEGDWMDIFTDIIYHGDQPAKNVELKPSTIMDGQYVDGQSHVRVGRSLAQMPVFAKLGAILPLNPNFMESIDQLPKKLDIHVFGLADNEYTLYEHQNEIIAKTVFSMHNGELAISVDDPEGIIPKDREFTLVKHGFDQNKQETRAFDRLVDQLQFAHLDYELKREVLKKAKDASHDPIKFSAFAKTLNNAPLETLIDEYVYTIS